MLLQEEIEKAVGVRPAAQAKTRLPESYPTGRCLSSPNIQFSQKHVLAGAALGGLMVYLLERDLPVAERRFGWALAETWLRELVAARRVKGVA